ncbi:hypothetical protein E3N88_09612 [Mikania micrantha]|uniref:PGG domain-containing protein n=1 Tax=Mikania micrantha TaxID=192012 RepID=A0A5N6PLS8_9ASTR|nr:hypothetical protein E3N88_09612 [Mikania micrantha]
METKKQIKMEGSSSSNLGNPYLSHVTMKLSGLDTYDGWKTQMLCLLKSHDMLCFIQQNTPHEYMHHLWERSDALVKGWILGSLSNQTLKDLINSIPNEDFTAKDAWDMLQTVYDPPVRAVQKLHAAILVENYSDVTAILAGGIVTLSDRITINGNTALHMAVGTSKKKSFLERMLNLATKDNQQPLVKQNSEGSTLLHVAAIVGNTEAAKMLVQHERCNYMLLVTDNEGQTPLERAVSNMHTDTCIYLLNQYLDTPSLERVESFDGSDIVVNTISSKDYVSAYKMRNSIKDPEIVLMAIAQNFPPEVTSGDRLLPFPQISEILNGDEVMQRRRKAAYRHAKLLVDFTCNLIRTPTTYNNVIFEATRQDAVELVKEIISRFPNAIWTSNEDGHDIIQLAVINRSEKVYNLLYQMSKHKNIYRTIQYPFKNNLLHLAARLAPENKLKPTYGPALQMQQELKWFKAVERFVTPLNVIQKNSFGETPQMVFTKEHKKLAIDGEKWMKETAQSYTIIAALITTIMFAATITVPGGNKQDSGIPVFTNIKAFTVFGILGAVSFVASATSLLAFLSILTNHFSEQDFLSILPKKLAIGVYSLIISTYAMLLAFVVAFSLVYGQKRVWLTVVASILISTAVSVLMWHIPILTYLVAARYDRSKPRIRQVTEEGNLNKILLPSHAAMSAAYTTIKANQKVNILH